MSPKERVRVNVYKALLEEEKKKNKRKSYLSISIFVIGVFAGSIYNFVPAGNVQDFDQVKNFVVETGEKTLKNNMESIDNFFSKNSIEQEQKEIKTDEYFIMNMQV
ncbi:hypothetical protein [Fusobacterium sp.]|uniref:hypothetical protein n=1 Tax=Fusobacterium sp. TaxID=68766 RepID=UPI00263971FB|nr:hypothetical protein [Fusobacterium sp.]